ncbi:MAG: uracil-DNA glycosylase [Planctomycetaceae bacterium]|nr:uracil-DNA glycosylase [Planctomycetaceae bacterium]
MKQGFHDFLEVLQMSGIADWGPFVHAPEDAERIKRFFAAAPVTVPPVEPPPSPPLPTPHSPPSSPSSPSPEMPRKSASPKNRASALALLAAEVAQCEQCRELVEYRTQTVFGTGNPNAELVFLGEAPGADEDKQGVPFVGRAGQLLTDMITKGMKLNREDVYICNVLRCRPPGNRNPDPKEAANCRAFLDRTLEIIKPKYICCLGAVAAQNLLATDQTIGNLRGQVFDYHGIKVVCTYHPAYLLRSPDAKGKAWEDLKLLMREMGITR